MKFVLAAVASLAVAEAAVSPRAIDPTLLPQLPGMFLAPLKGCYKAAGLPYSKCIAANTVKSLNGINAKIGPGLSADTNAAISSVVKTADAGVKKCASSATQADYDKCLQTELSAAAGKATGLEKQLIGVLGSYTNAVKACAAKPAAALEGCTKAAVGKVFNQLVPLLK